MERSHEMIKLINYKDHKEGQIVFINKYCDDKICYNGKGLAFLSN